MATVECLDASSFNVNHAVITTIFIMKDIQLLCRVGLVSALIFSSPAFSNSVKALSQEQLIQYGNDKASWEVEVSCSGSKLKRTIRQEVDAEEWCAKEVGGYCHANKQRLANMVCGTKFSRELKNALKAQKDNGAEKKSKTSAIQLKAKAQSITKKTNTPVSKKESVSSTDAVRNTPAGSEIGPYSVIKPREVNSPKDSNLSKSLIMDSELSIEEERIRLEEEKLNLRRRELELNKKSLQIQRQREAAVQ